MVIEGHLATGYKCKEVAQYPDYNPVMVDKEGGNGIFLKLPLI